MFNREALKSVGQKDLEDWAHAMLADIGGLQDHINNLRKYYVKILEEAVASGVHPRAKLLLEMYRRTNKALYTMRGLPGPPLPGVVTSEHAQAFSDAVKKEVEERMGEPVSESLDKLCKASAKFVLGGDEVIDWEKLLRESYPDNR